MSQDAKDGKPDPVLREDLPLFDVPPLIVNPILAFVLGLNEAIVIQQLHYWLQRSDNVHERRYWVYKSLKEWRREFPWWSEDTIQRTLSGLAKAGLVKVTKNPHDRTDRRNWYSLDFEAMTAKCGGASRGIAEVLDDRKMRWCMTAIPDDQLTENTNRDYTESTETREARFFDQFWEAYNSIGSLQAKNRTKAREAFIKARKSATFETIMEGVVRLKAHVDRVADRARGFVPAPAAQVWLNKSGWLEEYPTENGGNAWNATPESSFVAWFYAELGKNPGTPTVVPDRAECIQASEFMARLPEGSEAQARAFARYVRTHASETIKFLQAVKSCGDAYIRSLADKAEQARLKQEEEERKAAEQAEAERRESLMPEYIAYRRGFLPFCEKNKAALVEEFVSSVKDAIDKFAKVGARQGVKLENDKLEDPVKKADAFAEWLEAKEGKPLPFEAWEVSAVRQKAAKQTVSQ